MLISAQTRQVESLEIGWAAVVCKQGCPFYLTEMNEASKLIKNSTVIVHQVSDQIQRIIGKKTKPPIMVHNPRRHLGKQERRSRGAQHRSQYGNRAPRSVPSPSACLWDWLYGICRTLFLSRGLQVGAVTLLTTAHQATVGSLCPGHPERSVTREWGI